MDAHGDIAPGQFLEQLHLSRNNLKMAKSTLRELSLKAIIEYSYRGRSISLTPGLAIRATRALANWAFSLWGREPAPSPSPSFNALSDKLKKLPSTLKSDLIKMAVEDFEKEARNKKSASEELCSFVAALMHSDLVAVQLPTLDSTGETPPTDAKTKFQTLMEAIGAESPSLRLLNVRTLETKTPPLLTMGSPLGETFFGVLPRLKSLRVVRLELFHCDDWALQQFAVHATNLVVLQVELSLDISSVGFEALSTLRYLRQFHFGEYFGVYFEIDWELYQKCIMLCARYLPQLKFTGSYNDFLCGSTQSPVKYNELVQQHELPKLSLSDLTIGSDVEPHEDLELPELESLSLWLPMKDIVGLCDRFSSISALALYNLRYAPSDIIITVLHTVGKRLRSLSLSDAPQPLSLAQIFEFCPRLESFRIEFCNFNDAPTVQWPARYFSCAKEARVGAQRHESHLDSQSLPRGFIMQLLKSPSLRRLDFCEVFLTKSETNELLALVRERRILETVNCFVWWNWYYPGRYLESLMADKHHFELLLNTIELHYPQMKLIRSEL